MAGRALGEPVASDIFPIMESDITAFSHQAAEVVRAAHRELETLMRQRTEIMRRIGTVKKTLVGLTSIFDCSALSRESLTTIGEGFSSYQAGQTGLTNSCRMALLQAGVPLRPSQVRDRLRFQGLALENHRDPVASVTTILRRLEQYGEAKTVTLPDGKRAWEWVAGSITAPIEQA
jgi:hypothetical protein